MKTKTLIIFLLFICSMIGTMFSVNSSFAQDCSGGGYGPGCGCEPPECDNETPPPPPPFPPPPEKQNPPTDNSIIYFYCSQSNASNYQTQGQCRETNKARPQDSCIANISACSMSTSASPLTGASALSNNNIDTNTGTSPTGISPVVPLPVEITALDDKTLCVRQDFNSMPDFSNMVVFNNTYKLCSNGGVYTKTNSITK